MLSPYAAVVEKLHRDFDKEKVTMLKIERAGDVLADTVSLKTFCYLLCLMSLISARQSRPSYSSFL